MDGLTGEVSLRCRPDQIPRTSLHAEGSSAAGGDDAQAALCPAATNADRGQVLLRRNPRIAPILSNRRQKPGGITEVMQCGHDNDQRILEGRSQPLEEPYPSDGPIVVPSTRGYKQSGGSLRRCQ